MFLSFSLVAWPRFFLLLICILFCWRSVMTSLLSQVSVLIHLFLFLTIRMNCSCTWSVLSLKTCQLLWAPLPFRNAWDPPYQFPDAVYLNIHPLSCNFYCSYLHSTFRLLSGTVLFKKIPVKLCPENVVMTQYTWFLWRTIAYIRERAYASFP